MREERHRVFNSRISAISAIAFCSALILFALNGCSSETPSDETEAQPQATTEAPARPAPVVVASVTMQTVGFALTYSESCRGVREAKISSRRPGRITKIYASLGDALVENDPILQIDDELERLTLATAQAGFDLAEIALEKSQLDLDRSRTLLSDSLISQSRFELVEIAQRKALAEMRSAEASLGLARKNLADTRVFAPINGEVTLLPFEVGETPQLGSVVAEVVDRSQLLVDLFVTERDLSLITIGDVVEAKSGLFPESVFSGKVRAISPKASELSRLFQIEVVIENRQLLLRSGLTVDVEVGSSSGESRILAPLSAVIEREGATVVALARGAQVRFQEVEVGERFGVGVEIVSGLTLGDRLIVVGASGLGDDALIEIVQEVSIDSLLD